MGTGPFIPLSKLQIKIDYFECICPKTGKVFLFFDNDLEMNNNIYDVDFYCLMCYNIHRFKLTKNGVITKTKPYRKEKF